MFKQVMPTRADRLLDLAAALSDGAPVDWDAAESSAASDSERRQIHHLRLVRRLADAQAAESFAGAPPAMHDSLLHPSNGGTPPARDDAAPITWGPLRVIEKIGRGRFGDVYRAWDPRLDREVALKLLRRRESRTDDVGSAVIEEGRLLAKVRHPNVVTVYGAERIDDRVGVWMELVHGRTLEDELAARGPLPAADVAAVGRDICGALAAVHRAGLLHRDIKAQNVMRDEDGRIVLMDFGTGREVDTDAPPELAGTPLYLAPEVMSGGSATPASDLYSVGVLLYHLMTRAFPVNGKTLREIREAHGRQPDDGVGVSQAVELGPLREVLDRVLQPRSSARYATATALAGALDACCARQEPEPSPPPRRRLTRSRMALMLATAAALTVGVWLGFGWLSSRGRVANPARVAPSGQTARQLWTGSGVDGSGSVSADGRYLAFTDWETGDLALRDLWAGTNTRLTNSGGWVASGDWTEGAVFSPDSRQVVYQWLRGADHAAELRVVSVDHPVPRVLTKLRGETWLAPIGFMPGGSAVVVVRSTSSGSDEFGIVGLTDGQYRTIKRLEKHTPQKRTSLSPDGRYLAYDVSSAENGSPRDVRVVTTDGAEDWAIVDSPSNDSAPIWSPDGSHLLFLSDRTGATALWAVPVNHGRSAGSPVVLKADIGAIRPLGMSRTGALYYVTAGTARRNIFSTELANLRAVRAPTLAVDRFVNGNSGPAWSRDAKYLAYYSVRPRPILVVRTDATGEEHDYPLPAGVVDPFFSGPRWFPDNRALLILCRNPIGNKWTFYRLVLASGKAEPLHSPAFNPSSFALAPDGRSIFYALQHAGEAPSSGLLVKYDLRLEREVVLRRGEWFITVAISPDGSKLAYFKSFEPNDGASYPGAIFVMPSSGGDAIEIFRDQKWTTGSRYNTLAWTPDQQSLLFVRDDGELWRVPATGGLAEKTGVGGSIRIKMPALHPDGRRLVFGKIEDSSEVWALENFLPSAGASAAAAAEPATATPPAATTAAVDRAPAPQQLLSSELSIQSVSRDGRFVVAQRPGSNTEVRLRDLSDGTERVLLASNPSTRFLQLRLSPDGTRAAYTARESSGYSLRELRTESGSTSETLLTRDETVLPIAFGWAPDNQTILVGLLHYTTPTLGRLASTELGWFSRRTKSLRLIATLPGFQETSFQLSPDGSWIAYAAIPREGSADSYIYVMDAEGRRSVPVVTIAGSRRNPIWTEDGSHLLFVGDARGQSALWSIGISGGRATGEPRIVQSGFDGNAIRVTNTGDLLYRRALDGGNHEYLVSTVNPGRGPVEVFRGLSGAWSPDGRFLAFYRESAKFGDTDLIVRNLTTGEERSYQHAGMALSQPRWFHDGSAVIVHIGPAGDGSNNTGGAFYRVDLATAAFQRVASRVDGEHARSSVGALSLDDRELYLPMRRVRGAGTPITDIVAVDLHNGTERSIFQFPEAGLPGATFPGLALSPDGKTLAGLAATTTTTPGPARIFTVSIGGAGYRDIAGPLAAGSVLDVMRWTSDGRWIVYVERQADDKWRLMRVPATGGVPQSSGWDYDRLSPLLSGRRMAVGNFNNLDLSPDGSRAAFSSLTWPTFELWQLDLKSLGVK